MSQDRRLSSAPRLDSRTKILYGIGNIANAVKTVLAGLFGLYFYTSVMGLSGTLVGITSAITLVWDALVDPYIGYLSDKARFRFGRRHTFMLAGALTMGIGFWASFSPPQGLSTGALVAWLLGSGFLVRTATSMYSVPYFALGAELSQDYHERTSIAGIRAIMAFLGTLGTASLSFVVFFPNSPTGVDPKLNYAGYPAMGITFGLLMTVVSLIATFGTLSRRHALPMNDKRQMAQTPRNCFISFANSFQNPSFRVLVASTILFWLGVTISGSLSIYYLTYFAEISASTTLSVCQLAFYLAGLLGVCLWLRIAKMVEKHRMYRFSMLVTAALMLGAFLLIGEGSLFGTGNVGAVVTIYAMDGFFGCALWFMPMSLIADAVDEDELTTGQRREGTFFGVYSCGQQLAVGISFLLTGVLVDWFAGLVPGQATQSPETVWRVGLLYGALPAMLLCIAAALTCRYTLGQARVLTIQAELAKQRSPLTSY